MNTVCGYIHKFIFLEILINLGVILTEYETFSSFLNRLLLLMQ